MSRPFASLAETAKRMTSPCRARGLTGEIATDVSVAGSTSIVFIAFTLPACAVSTAWPAPTAVSIPSASMRATLGAALVQRMASRERSFTFVNARADICSCCPATIFRTGVRISTREAGPGTMRNSSGCTFGRVPGTTATTLMGILPTELAMSVPVESMDPSPSPPRATKRMMALSIFRPAASSASAENFTVSPATTSNVAGVTTMRATGDSGIGGAGCCA